MVGIVNVPTTNTNDGADVLVTIGSPVSQSYNATVSGGVAVVSIDDEDLQNANDVTVAMFLTDGTQTDDATLLIDISGVVAYEVLDVAAAVAGFEVREYVNTDPADPLDPTGAVVTSITPSEQYVIRALWQDTDGVYAGDSVGDLQLMDVDLGNESFVGRDGTTNYNLYLYTAPSTNATVQDATFTYGKYDDATLTTSQNVSIGIPVTVLVVNSILASDMGTTEISGLTDAQFTALFQAGSSAASRQYVVGEDAASVVQDALGEYWLEVVTTPSSIGSNHVSAFHDVAGIDTTMPISIEQVVEFGSDWTPGSVFKVQKLGSGIQSRATNDSTYVVGGSTNKTGWSARFEVYGPNGPSSTFTENDANIGGYIYYVGWEDGSFLSRHVETNIVVSAGSIYHMRATITPNTTGNSDGAYELVVSEIDVNGNVLNTDTATKTGIMWMQGAFNVDGLSFDVFNGGNDADYSAVGGAFSARYKAISIN